MGKVRGHDPVVIEELNGLWNRGDPETCPSDHLLIADNIEFIHSGVRTRNAIEPYTSQPVSVQFQYDLRDLVRIYSYTRQNSQSLIAMRIDHPSFLPPTGQFFHITKTQPITVTFIGSIPKAQDFAAITIAERVYISPIEYRQDSAGNQIALGLTGESLYVFDGSSQLRKAAGVALTNGSKKSFLAYNSERDGKITAGHHIFAICFDDGKMGPDVLPTVICPGGKTVQLANIPKGGTTRTIVMTKAGVPYTPGVTLTPYFVAKLTDPSIESFLVDISDAELTTPYTEGAPAKPITNALSVFNPPDAGFCDLGLHLVGVVYETNTGYISAPGPEFFAGNSYIENKTVRIFNIPLGPSTTVRRHIVSTKWIADFYSGDQKAYQFFFVPKGTIENNTDTTIDVNYYDSDLVSDASHLIDNLTQIPAGVSMCTYHSRLVIVGDSSFPKNSLGVEDKTHGDNRSVAWVSAPGEPEAISAVDGLIVSPRDGKPLTHCEEFRDILYLFKHSRTYAYSDNEDEPGTWKEEVLDLGVGTSINGIAEVLDSGGINIDYLIVADYSGLLLFNGTYARPELSWKIEDMWINQGRSNFNRIQIVNDTISKKFWILPGNGLSEILYHVDYSNGLDPKAIRFSRWIFNLPISCIALINTDQLVVALYGPGDVIQPVPAFLKRPGPQVIVDGQIIWDDEQDPFPPVPVPAEVQGGLVIIRRSNPSKHDVYYDKTTTAPMNLPIKARIRTAFLGD
jgi:hypothetical protein